MAERRTGGALSALRCALPHTIPVFTGYLILGMAYGVLMRDKGYGVLWSGLMSALVFGGSIQYAAITLLTAAFDPVQAFLLSLLVNARHAFYGVTMLDRYRNTGVLKPFLVSWLTDETYSVVSCTEVPEGAAPRWFYFWVSALDWSYWVLGSVLGGVAGGFIRFNTKGLDFALTALFIVLFVEQWKKRENRASCLVGLGCSALSLLLFGQSSFIIPAMLGIAAILLIGRGKLCS